MQYQTLKERHRRERDGEHLNLRLRVHRALSWLDRAEQADDLDGRFIFLWIAFNAAYACEIDERQRLSEQETFKAFLEKLCLLDEKKRIDALIWQEFSSSIRVLLDNQYVFQSFWDHQSGKIDESTWKARFASGNTSALLGGLYTLRNQLIHGGATWGGSVNREQLRDCTNLLGKLVPLIIESMMDSPDTLWGMPVIRW